MWKFGFPVSVVEQALVVRTVLISLFHKDHFPMIIEKIAHIWIEQDVVFLAPIQRKDIGIFPRDDTR